MNKVIKIEVYDEDVPGGEGKPGIHIINIEPAKISDPLEWKQKTAGQENEQQHVSTVNKIVVCNLVQKHEVATSEKDSEVNLQAIRSKRRLRQKPRATVKKKINNYEKAALTDSSIRQSAANQLPVEDNDHETRKPSKRKCKVCGKEVANMQDHLVVHTGEQPYKCDKCNKRFNLKGNYLRHRLIHTDVFKTAFQCDICEKGFNSSTSLRYHSRIHTGNLLKCTICDKDFTIPAELKRHVATHLEGMIDCDICGRQYAGKIGLRKHRRRAHGIKSEKVTNIENNVAADENGTKQNIKPLKKRSELVKENHYCIKCKKGFTLKKDFLQHSCVVKRLSHRCDVCNEVFSSTAVLHRHMKSHSDVATNRNQLYTCGKCGKPFTVLAELKQHQIKSCNGESDASNTTVHSSVF
ncbi:zinc finger protein 184-like [Sabethes cyaneus]|uniref:zinc finger protein 184-like n=1 Tax=Sabethes cyaneus TaxID=53552 RepID=UPI00237E728A|nr:zinc finger protein 184-like [Sabethes cyaneus]